MRPLHSLFVRRMYGDPCLITPETLPGYALPLSRPGNFEHAVKIVRTWHADMRELQAVLPKISSVPTLLVWGSKDRVVDPASAEPLRQNFHTARITIIEGAGHLPYEERPEEFSRIVGDFLATTGSGAMTLYGK
jgi:pimeloyl-ACP methyl ester carboxylesterase